MLSINIAFSIHCIITCHQHSHDCFIRMPLIHFDCSITVHSHNIVSPLILPVSENLSNFLELTLLMLKSLMVITDTVPT